MTCSLCGQPCIPMADFEQPVCFRCEATIDATFTFLRTITIVSAARVDSSNTQPTRLALVAGNKAREIYPP